MGDGLVVMVMVNDSVPRMVVMSVRPLLRLWLWKRSRSRRGQRRGCRAGGGRHDSRAASLSVRLAIPVEHEHPKGDRDRRERASNTENHRDQSGHKTMLNIGLVGGFAGCFFWPEFQGSLRTNTHEHAPDHRHDATGDATDTTLELSLKTTKTSG
jgi:hypothetical protein